MDPAAIAQAEKAMEIARRANVNHLADRGVGCGRANRIVQETSWKDTAASAAKLCDSETIDVR